MKNLKTLIILSICAFLFSACSTLNEESHTTAIELTKMNVLYLGIENPVQVAVTGVLAENIELTGANCVIKKTEDGYAILPEDVEELTLTVKVNEKDVVEKKFRVLNIPSPEITIAGKTGGVITKEEVLNAEGIEVELKNFLFDIKFKVVSFNVTASAEGYSIEAGANNSDKFTKKQMRLLRKAKMGSKFYIEDITVVGPDNIERKVGTASFKIVE